MLYYFYVILGEDDPVLVENFMSFSHQVGQQFFDLFLKYYLDTEYEDRFKEVTERTSVLGYARLTRKLRKRGEPSPEGRVIIDRCLKRLGELTAMVGALAF